MFIHHDKINTGQQSLGKKQSEADPKQQLTNNFDNFDNKSLSLKDIAELAPLWRG